MDDIVNREWREFKENLSNILEQMVQDNNPESDTLKVMLNMLKNSKTKERK